MKTESLLFSILLIIERRLQLNLRYKVSQQDEDNRALRECLSSHSSIYFFLNRVHAHGRCDFRTSMYACTYVCTHNTCTYTCITRQTHNFLASLGNRSKTVQIGYVLPHGQSSNTKVYVLCARAVSTVFRYYFPCWIDKQVNLFLHGVRQVTSELKKKDKGSQNEKKTPCIIFQNLQ